MSSTKTPKDFGRKEVESPDEKFAAVARLTLSIEDNFLTLGQILADIKSTKLFLFKGYEKFSSYVSEEYNFNPGLAAKLIGIYELFVNEMDMFDVELANIGFDRLCMIKPLMKNADWALRDELVGLAAKLPPAELKEHIKKLKDEDKKANIDLKDVYVEQYLERMLSLLNCSRKELSFKLALYFNPFGEEDLQDLKAIIRQNQKHFEKAVKEAENADSEE